MSENVRFTPDVKPNLNPKSETPAKSNKPERHITPDKFKMEMKTGDEVSSFSKSMDPSEDVSQGKKEAPPKNEAAPSTDKKGTTLSRAELYSQMARRRR